MLPQRIVILGAPGAGKSRLARLLAQRLDLPVVHLDRLFWRPGWTPSDAEGFRDRVHAALAGDRWISDGVFIKATGDLRLPRADLIVWIEQPVWLRLLRSIQRMLDPRERSRPDLPEGCRDSLDARAIGFIFDFDRLNRPMLDEAITRLAPDKPLIRLHGDRAVARFLASLARP